MTTRGFSKLRGVTIKSVSAKCINQVVLTDTNGTRYIIDADLVGNVSLPEMTLTVQEPKQPVTK